VEWATGSQVESRFGHTPAGYDDRVTAVATVDIDGRPHAVTGSEDETVRIWDLTTGDQVGDPLTGHEGSMGSVTAVATVDIDGRPHVIAGAGDGDMGAPFYDAGSLWVWDLTTGEQLGEELAGHDSLVTTVATVDIDGRPHAVTGSEDAMLLSGSEVRVWDLTLDKQVGDQLEGHVGSVGAVTAMTTVQIDGRPHAVIVTGGEMRVWDLTTRQPVGEPLVTHDDDVHAVVTVELDGHLCAVTGSADGTVRVWDLATRRRTGPELVFPSEVHALAVTADNRLAVAFGQDVAVLSPC
jgi:WD40 repeat protein